MNNVLPQGSLVDDTDVFLQSVRSSYPTFEGFLQDFRDFQKKTSSSFYMYNSRTARQYLKDEGGKLPPGFPYKFVKFCCVHRKRKSNEGKRYMNYNCEASLVVRAVGTEYRIVKSDMVHNHSFHVGKPSLYVRNRRLSEEEELHLFELMNSIKNTRGLIQYALERFNKRLLPADVRSIRDRLSKTQTTSENQDSVSTHVPNDVLTEQEHSLPPPPLPPVSVSNENCVVVVVPDNVPKDVIAKPVNSSDSNYKDALTEQLMTDFARTLKKLNDSQFKQQLKALRLLNEALNYWPRIELFARMPGFNEVVSLSESETVSELFEKCEQRSKHKPFVSSVRQIRHIPRPFVSSVRCRATAAAATTNTTAAHVSDIRRPASPKRDLSCPRLQPTQSSSKRKPLLALRHTFVDDVNSSSSND